MPTSTSIPVTITDEAAARIEELGMRREFEQMVEHARQSIPGLRALEVTLDHAPWLTPEPRVILNAHRPHLGPNEAAAKTAWREWVIQTFPPEILLHFLLTPFYEVEQRLPSRASRWSTVSAIDTSH